MQAETQQEMRPTTGDSDWFVQDRFGLFIHWGIYALPARHEWVRHNEKITNEEYQKYFERFDPDLYDPRAWARAAREAGMKYFVITTKHHDGFCLWDSALTDYKATNTPHGRDLLTPMVEAFRAEGLHVGFYHSLIDWHHSDFIIDDVHALRDHADRDRMNEGRDPKRYTEYLHGQVRELLTNFGKIDILWFDFSYPSREGFIGKGRDDWQSAQLLKLVRQLQPDILLNDRLDLGDDVGAWDLKTPEQFQPRVAPDFHGQPIVWEACQTLSGSWGYHRDENSWKSVDQLLLMLIDSVSKGGNMLLNVGPTARGDFDSRALNRLSGMGAWMRGHERSIRGCKEAPQSWITPEDCRLTWNAGRNRLYIHIFAWPFKRLYLQGPIEQIAYAQLLNDASEVKLVHKKTSDAHTMMEEEMPDGMIGFDLPIQKPDVAVAVVEVFLK
jgi:alpha-L-fucosidase